MTEKLALQIAYNILRDELERIKEEDIGFGYEEEYYQEVKDATEKIKEMVSHRQPLCRHENCNIFVIIFLLTIHSKFVII